MKKTVCIILLIFAMLLSSCYIVVPDSWAAYEVSLKSL